MFGYIVSVFIEGVSDTINSMVEAHLAVLGRLGETFFCTFFYLGKQAVKLTVK
jgi:hypothetical protein